MRHRKDLAFILNIYNALAHLTIFQGIITGNRAIILCFSLYMGNPRKFSLVLLYFTIQGFTIFFYLPTSATGLFTLAVVASFPIFFSTILPFFHYQFVISAPSTIFRSLYRCVCSTLGFYCYPFFYFSCLSNTLISLSLSLPVFRIIYYSCQKRIAYCCFSLFSHQYHKGFFQLSVITFLDKVRFSRYFNTVR